MTWHADGPTLARYQAAALGPAAAASVEAHLDRCGDCRAALATMADPSRLARNWAAVEDRLDDGARPVLLRLLLRLGVHEHHARLVLMTPALRGPSIAGVVAVLTVVVLAAQADGGSGDAVFSLFLVLAPLLPLAGVAAAFGGFDPLHELTRTAPTPAFELLLTRAVAILVTTTVLSALTALPLPLHGWEVAAWLLPALGLSAASLALSTWIPAHWAAAGLGSAWVAAAALSWRVNRFDADVLERFVALGPLGQLVCAALAATGAVVVVLRRDTLEFRRFP